MTSQPIYSPRENTIARTNMAKFMRSAELLTGTEFADYDALWRWSVDQPQEFWPLVWEKCRGIGSLGAEVAINSSHMINTQWFPQANINYAENLLKNGGDTTALVFWGEDKIKRHLTKSQLREQVARCQESLEACGVGFGDRVCGLLPNLPETIIAMLATTSLGAIWSSASPDFGVQGVLDRFAQIDPKVMFCVDGYLYNGKYINCMEKNALISAQLPSLQKTIVVPYILYSPSDISAIPNGVCFDDFLESSSRTEVKIRRVSFNHPLFIMFSSGTTGVPKCIVHGHGGVLLQHLKEHLLHADVKPSDRIFFFTTCSWMMWNWLVSGLASQATLLLYDGSPFAPGRDGLPGSILFDYADEEGMTHLGISAKFLDALSKNAISPRASHQLIMLRMVLSTGSPLSPEGFEYVHKHIKTDVHLASISGGTDILSCFVGGVPTLPVYSGEIQRPGLGMAVDVFNENGQSIREQKGELVCTRAFPAMPVGFWDDDDRIRYHSAYFERFHNVWCHGDFAEVTANGGYIIHGRSDATLNPGGVRIGTAEIYRQVEKLDEVIESVVIGQNWEGDTRIVLFVRLREPLQLSENLITQIKNQIVSNTTPRHVPARILQVGAIPRTKSGKIVELAVRNVVHDLPVNNIEALANPEALEEFMNRRELLE